MLNVSIVQHDVRCSEHKLKNQSLEIKEENGTLTNE